MDHVFPLLHCTFDPLKFILNENDHLVDVIERTHLLAQPFLQCLQF